MQNKGNFLSEKFLEIILIYIQAEILSKNHRNFKSKNNFFFLSTIWTLFYLIETDNIRNLFELTLLNSIFQKYFIFNKYKLLI
jgi:hypothetical protein